MLVAHFVCFGLKNKTRGGWDGEWAGDRGNEKKSFKSLSTLLKQKLYQTSCLVDQPFGKSETYQ